MISGKLSQNVYLKKYDLLKKGSLIYFKELLNNQKLSQLEIKKIQEEKFTDLIKFASSNSVLYKGKYQNIPLNEILTERRYECIPILKREEVRERSREILTDGLREVNKITTGGSTGEPLTIYHPKKVNRAAALWRVFSWYNISPCDTIATVYRVTADSFREKTKSKIIQWPQKRVELNATNLCEKAIRDWLNRCNKERPPVLHGYVGAIEHIANFILENGITVWRPSVIWVTSAPLTETAHLKIKMAFNADICDQYGSCESFYTASENPFGKGLSVFSDIKFLEIVNEDGTPAPPNVDGKIILTDLENFSFPLIRYDTGDIGKWLPDSPADKLPFPRIDSVKGRESDTLHFPDGKSISGEYWTTLFDRHPTAVEKFQVIQNHDAGITIRYIPNKKDPNHIKHIQAVKRNVEKEIGGKSPVHLKEVSAIPLVNGKNKYVIRDI